MRNFINGPLAGTRLEIMPSRAATTLPDGTPIRELTLEGMNSTQLAHAAGDLDVHARQLHHIQDATMVGPSIAQQWKNEYNAMRTQRGWTARYYREAPNWEELGR